MNYCKTSKNLEDTKEIAEEIAKLCTDKQINIIFLNGEMGAGKTTFTKYFASYYGCDENSASPTFTILNTYENKNIKILHFDLYRIESIDELEQTGFFEYVEDDGIIIIEWAEKIDLADYFENIIEINIKKDVNNRIFEINY